VFFALAAVHIGFAARGVALVRDEIGLILELLSRRACPAGVMQLLRLGVAGVAAVVATALALALVPHQHAARPALSAGLVAHAGCSLCRAPVVGGGGPFTKVRPPAAAHVVTLGACAPAVWHAGKTARRRALLRPETRGAPKLKRLAQAAPPLATVALGVVANLAPAATATVVLHCAGQTLELPACGVACVGAALLPLGIGTAALCRDQVEEREAADGRGRHGAALPTTARRILAGGLALGGLAQAAVVLCGAHADAMVGWARAMLAVACWCSGLGALACAW